LKDLIKEWEFRKREMDKRLNRELIWKSIFIVIHFGLLALVLFRT